MKQFNKENLDSFLGTVRKYMQMRGSLSQKDLAHITETGVSTMSRFLNKKTQDLDEQLIANIVAKLEIPLHEIIDFVDETYNDRFLKLVKFYKNEEDEGGAPPRGGEGEAEDIEDVFKGLGTAQKTTRARVKVGGKTRTIPFMAQADGKNTEKTVKELFADLTPRQKAYLNDFLHLDMEGKDLIVDVGNSLFRYFRQKGTDLFE